MAKKLYKPKKEKIETQKTGGYFSVDRSKTKKSYGDYTRKELIAEIKRLEKRKSYGLVWDDQEEKFDKDTIGKLPVLKEIKNRAIQKDKNLPINLLIEGDNYHSLSVLNYTHEKMVDVIYIDPPYNTGNQDFIYNDRYVDREDSYRHSKWLSFMKKRLKLAKNLLKETGMIFISIDDNEVAQLKLLLDDPTLFGEKNFIAQFIWNKKTGRQNDARFVSTNHEYVLCYLRNSEKGKINLLPRTEELNKTYKNPDNDPRGPWSSVTLQAKSGRESDVYEMKFPNGIKWRPPRGTYPKFTKENLLKLYHDNRIWFGKSGKNVPRLKKFLSEVKQGLVPNTLLLPNEVGSTQRAKTDYKKILPDINFDNPKPLQLIKCLAIMGGDENAIILDFFAGSGTTGHAVLNLNAEDGGNRQFILCTNNENNIATDICYPRIKRAIGGYKDKKGKKTHGVSGNLKYFKTSFVGATPTDANKKKLTDQSTEMLCIRENTFEKILERKHFKIFKNSEKHTGIVFDQLAINDFKKAVKNIKGPIHTYIFSLEDEDFSSEFKDMDGRIIVSPIPEVILRVYRRIFGIKI